MVKIDSEVYYELTLYCQGIARKTMLTISVGEKSDKMKDCITADTTLLMIHCLDANVIQNKLEENPEIQCNVLRSDHGLFFGTQ